MDLPSISEQADQPYISTGHLPESEIVQRLVSDAHQRFKSDSDGHNSQVYPALARVPRELFGVCAVGTSGRILAGLALLAIVPAGRLPNYLPGEIPSDAPTGSRVRSS